MPFDGTLLALNNTCTIQRRTFTLNDKNQKVPGAYDTLSEDIICRLISKSGREMLDGKVIILSHLKLFLPFGQDILEDDRVVIDDSIYLVDYVNDNPGNSAHHIEAELVLVES